LKKIAKENPDKGVKSDVINKYLESLGWKFVWMGKMGGKMYINDPYDFPSGKVIVQTYTHLVAIIDNIILDTFNCENKLKETLGYFYLDKNN
jgi:hypothetical protein